ncbi:MAG: homoserine dehydrogenase [Acidobacteriia bacterium]|nr:homoserine dehydrogenase [Terriglobia bacterium]
MHYKLALIGFGNVGKNFAKLLERKKTRLKKEFGITYQIVAIATGSHGLAINPRGLDARKILAHLSKKGSLAAFHRGKPVSGVVDLIKRCGADILFEISPQNPWTGQPALGYIEAALQKKMHVITANKGPIVHGYQKLRRLAARSRVQLRHEGVVMDGTPIFNLYESTLPATDVRGFEGILNATTNFLINAMENGKPIDTALEEAKALGIVEANPAVDVEGWDATSKLCCLANVLMGANLRPQDVDREGIQNLSPEKLHEARHRGNCIRLVVRAWREGRKVRGSVKPTEIPLTHTFATLSADTTILTLDTDTMEKISIVEGPGGPHQTAFALLSDFINVARA